MLELGNKQTGDHSYKRYFESIGITHTSVDWNGRDGALPMDLREPLNLGTFDMVTNLGTTEHVDRQRPVWENIHNAVKVGGVFVSMCPMPGDWHWHGEYYPTTEFYEQFAAMCGYRIDHMAIGREAPNRNIDVRMTKLVDVPFAMPNDVTMYRNKIRPRR
jgi:SAM-dependent methyltransferase